MQAQTFITCPECGQRVLRKHHRQLFCTTAHQVAYNRRVAQEGQAVMALAKAWRAGGSRSTKDAAMNQAAKEAYVLLCRLVDASNMADRKAGRMNPARMMLWRQANSLVA